MGPLLTPCSPTTQVTHAFDEDISATQTPPYILKVFPYVDAINWLINPVMYCFLLCCK